MEEQHYYNLLKLSFTDLITLQNYIKGMDTHKKLSDEEDFRERLQTEINNRLKQVGVEI